MRLSTVAVAIGIAALLLLRLVLAVQMPNRFTDLDDVMRLVTAHDLLNGQAFNDSFQPRDNFPFGMSMHWTHLVDLPIAGLLWLALPFGTPGADLLAQLVWPTLLLIVFLGLSVGITRRLAGDDATIAGLLAPVLTIPVLTEFAPGRLDHHNVQMVLLLAMAWGLIEARRLPSAAILAGMLAGVALAVGLEVLPVIVAAIGLALLALVADPRRLGFAVRNFAAGLLIASLALWVVTTPTANLGAAACDALSLPYVTGLAIITVILFGFSFFAMAMRRWQMRLAIGLAAAVIGAVATALIFPECLGGPYAQLDPELQKLMLGAVPEAQPWWVRLAVTPAFALALLVPIVVGVAVLIRQVFVDRSDRQTGWAILLVLALAALAVALVQVRGARLATVFVLPANAYLLQAAWRGFRLHGSALGALKVLSAALGIAGLAQLSLFSPLQLLAAPRLQEEPGWSAACQERDVYADFANLPEGGVMNFDDIGTFVLLYTPQSVVTTGFHRNPKGEADSVAFFNGTPAQARQIAQDRGLSYVALCRASERSAAFLRRMQGPGWDWLKPISLPGAPLTILQIDKL